MPYRIAVLPGDGIGPEVVREGLRVLSVVSEHSSCDMEFSTVRCGARYYKEHGSEWEEGGLDECGRADAVFLGAVGLPGVSLPSGDIAGAGVVFGLRVGLDLYANIRPVFLYPGVLHKVGPRFLRVWDDVDFVIVRENTEGLYAPVRGTLSRGGLDEVAVDTRLVTRKGAERVCRTAFEIAGKRHDAHADKRGKVTCIHKSNVLAGCRLFARVFDEVGRDFSLIEKEHALVDAFAQEVVRNPGSFDVCVTTNMFGDILSDLAAALQGGLGMAPSANVGERHALFEPVHGSAPSLAGADVANPIGAILSARMMCEWLGERKADEGLLLAARRIGQAVRDHLAEGRSLTPDLGGGARCSQVGKGIAEKVRGLYASS